MLKLKDIPRVKAGTCVAVAEVTDADPQIQSLAQRAKDLLGYVGLHANVTGQHQLGATSGPLTETLLKLEIDTLDASSVIRYQCEEAARKTEEAIREEFSDYVTGWFTAASWTKTELSSYGRAVPEFVINKAVQIKEWMPDVRFYIQHMNDPKADPFLVAVAGKEMYYIEAWDEPRFEGRL